eukprot:6772634-Prymnesium_polylepis.2
MSTQSPAMQKARARERRGASAPGVWHTGSPSLMSPFEAGERWDPGCTSAWRPPASLLDCIAKAATRPTAAAVLVASRSERGSAALDRNEPHPC